MFVFLALAFAIGFVAFGIGGTGGSGISDLFQNAGSATGGPSVGDAKDKIADGNLAAYKELADAYRAENKPEEAIAAGEQYVEARPKDYDFMRTLASDYEGQATRLREAAEIVQEDLTAKTGGTTFGLQPEHAPRARPRAGQDRPGADGGANQTLTEQYSGIQKAYTRATQLYQNAAVATPDDVLLSSCWPRRRTRRSSCPSRSRRTSA